MRRAISALGSGGSAFGLDAVSGIMAWLLAEGRGFAVGPARVPIVPGAILFDLLNGGDKEWGEESPYRALGLRACEQAGPDFRLGNAGAGLGAKAAVQLATQRLRIDGVFALGFPLHPAGKPDQVQAESLFRIIAPMLFLQGTRDRSCDLGALRRTLVRIGAPTALHVVEDADGRFKVTKRAGRSEQEVWAELLTKVDGWIQKLIGE